MLFQKIKLNNINLLERNSLCEGKYLLPKFNREYIIQGLVYIDKYYLFTSYSKNNKNSIVTIYDNNFNFIKFTELYNNAHVGGITYDNKNKIIWITDKGGTISGYSREAILKKDKAYPLDNCKKVPVGKNLINFQNIPAVAYITYNDNKIYVGNFTIKKKCMLKSYNINKDGLIDLNSEQIINNDFERFVQGIYFYNDFLFVSKSMGKYSKSKIIVYKYNNNKYEIYKKFIINFNMSEQLIINKNKILVASEYGSEFYGKKGFDLAVIELNKYI